MKNLSTIRVIILAVCIHCQLFAQNTFAPIGTKWYYSIGEMDDEVVNNRSCITIESMIDTIINGQSVRKLIVNRIKPDKTIESISSEFIRHSGDTVYYFNLYADEFVALYNFNLSRNDTAYVHKNKTRVSKGFFKDSVEQFSYIIDRVDSILINGNRLKRQKIVDNYSTVSNWCMKDQDGITGDDGNNYLIENYGSTAYLFGYKRGTSVATLPTVLRCIEFNGNIIYKNTAWDKVCDYTKMYNGINDISSLSKGISVYPNPVSGLLNLEDYEYGNVLNFNIVNSNGLIVLSLVGAKTINVSNLPKGLYFLICSSNTDGQLIKPIKFTKL